MPRGQPHPINNERGVALLRKTYGGGCDQFETIKAISDAGFGEFDWDQVRHYCKRHKIKRVAPEGKPYQAWAQGKRTIPINPRKRQIHNHVERRCLRCRVVHLLHKVRFLCDECGSVVASYGSWA